MRPVFLFDHVMFSTKSILTHLPSVEELSTNVCTLSFSVQSYDCSNTETELTSTHTRHYSERWQKTVLNVNGK